MQASSVQYGLECKILSQHEVKEYCGLVNNEDLVGGLWVPGIIVMLCNFECRIILVWVIIQNLYRH